MVSPCDAISLARPFKSVELSGIITLGCALTLLLLGAQAASGETAGLKPTSMTELKPGPKKLAPRTAMKFKKRARPEPIPLPQQVTALKSGEAKRLMEEGKWEEAVVVLKNLIREDPAELEVRMDLVHSLMQLRRRAEAVTTLIQRMGKVSRKKRARLTEKVKLLSKMFLTQEAVKHHQEGLSLFEKKRYGDALERFEKALRIEPDNVEVLVRLSHCQVIKKDYRSALLHLERARELNPYEPEIQLWYGRALHLTGRTAEAVRELRKAQKANPHSELTAVWLSESLIAARNRKEAIRVLTRDVAEEPFHLMSLLNLAKLSLGRSPDQIRSFWDARKHLQVALSRYEQYERGHRKKVRSMLHWSPHEPPEIKREVETLLREVEKKIQTHSVGPAAK